MRLLVILLLAFGAGGALADEPAAVEKPAKEAAAEVKEFKPPPGFATKKRGNVTLIYSSRDLEHNNAVALKSYVEAALKRTASRRIA